MAEQMCLRGDEKYQDNLCVTPIITLLQYKNLDYIFLI